MIDHAFKAAPFYPNRCDVRVEDGGRRRTQCAAPPSEHSTGNQTQQEIAGQEGWKHAVPVERPEARVLALGEYTVRLRAWISRVFGRAILVDRWERIARVVEEALELAQAEGMKYGEIGRILRRVYDRPKGEPSQEAAGLAVCLIAWADVANVNLDAAIRTEIDRVEAVPAEKIRAKQAEKVAAGTGLGCSTCSLCGAERIRIEDGTFGACGFLGCTDPLFDYRRENPDPLCGVCDGGLPNGCTCTCPKEMRE